MKTKRAYQYRGTGMKTANHRYCSQKSHAKKRGIEWQFTFEEWVKWWEDNLGPDWMQKRGCTQGKHQMARNGDKGPYAPWNVQCLTHEQNRKDAAKNGHVGKRRITDNEIFIAKTLLEGGERFSDVYVFMNKLTGVQRQTLYNHCYRYCDVYKITNTPILNSLNVGILSGAT